MNKPEKMFYIGAFGLAFSLITISTLEIVGRHDHAIQTMKNQVQTLKGLENKIVMIEQNQIYIDNTFCVDEIFPLKSFEEIEISGKTVGMVSEAYQPNPRKIVFRFNDGKMCVVSSKDTLEIK